MILSPSSVFYFLPQSPQSYCDGMISLHTQCSDFLAQAFDNDRRCVAALDRAFKTIVNKSPAPNVTVSFWVCVCNVMWCEWCDFFLLLYVYVGCVCSFKVIVRRMFCEGLCVSVCACVRACVCVCVFIMEKGVCVCSLWKKEEKCRNREKWKKKEQARKEEKIK